MKAVLFDLYETLVTENHPEWHVPAPRPGERLGIPQEDFNREWSARYQARMTGKLRNYSDVLREICGSCGIEPPEAEISLMQAERSAAKARPFGSGPGGRTGSSTSPRPRRKPSGRGSGRHRRAEAPRGR